VITLTMSHFAPWEEVMFVVRYEAQHSTGQSCTVRSSAKPHSAEFILSLPKGFVRNYEPNVTLSSYKPSEPLVGRGKACYNN
jgi:hypothetical protein